MNVGEEIFSDDLNFLILCNMSFNGRIWQFPF